MTTLHFNEQAAHRLKALYSTSDVVAQRSETLRHLALSPGETVIDIGCGPGFLCESMADAVGSTGRVVGLDVSEELLEFARARNKRDWLTYRKSDATALDTADNSFDVAVCTQVLEYVEDVDRALSEIHRVLKAGGRALIVDTDWDGIVWLSAKPERMAKILHAWESHCADPRLPRTLAPRLRTAGLRVDGVSAFSIINTDLHEDAFSHGMIGLITDYLVRQGKTPRQEIDAWVNELSELGREGRYFFAIMRFFFRATKPSVTP